MKEKSPLENVQLYPSDSFKIVIDNLTRKLFEMCLDSNETAEIELVESNLKKIKINIKISNLSGSKITMWEFDWAVFDAVISERIAGNEYTTAAIIARKLGASHTPTKAIRDAIIDSLEKFAVIRIVADLDDIKKFYESPIGHFKFRGYVLASELLAMKVNGQNAALINFLSKGVLFATSDMKNQILTCDQSLLEPPVRMTTRSISINHFFLRRILEMKGSAKVSKYNKRIRPLHNIILFDSLYRACGLKDLSTRQKQQTRETAEKILDFFVKKNFIKSYSVETGKTGKARAIIIEL